MEEEKMSITIRDVAKLAGVSPSTVSRVLNKTAPISEETAAHQNGYNLIITGAAGEGPKITKKNLDGVRLLL